MYREFYPPRNICTELGIVQQEGAGLGKKPSGDDLIKPYMSEYTGL